jgi:hypothetical protein
MTKKIIKKRNQKCKFNQPPSFTHNETDLWRQETAKAKESFNRVQNGKGDSPRPVDYEKYSENFDAIDWKNAKN